jgi:hypothetical protein
MVSVLISSAIDRGFEPRSGQTMEQGMEQEIENEEFMVRVVWFFH